MIFYPMMASGLGGRKNIVFDFLLQTQYN